MFDNIIQMWIITRQILHFTNSQGRRSNTQNWNWK